MSFTWDVSYVSGIKGSLPLIPLSSLASATRQLLILHKYPRILLDSQSISGHHLPDLPVHAPHVSFGKKTPS